MTKAERLPRWRLRRLNDEEREAYDRLRWHEPDAAERARLKKVLGWRRTREETVALALELEAAGRSRRSIAIELAVGDRYLRRLLEGVRPTPNAARKPSVHAGEVAPTRESDPGLPPPSIGPQKPTPTTKEE